MDVLLVSLFAEKEQANGQTIIIYFDRYTMPNGEVKASQRTVASAFAATLGAHVVFMLAAALMVGSQACAGIDKAEIASSRRRDNQCGISYVQSGCCYRHTGRRHLLRCQQCVQRHRRSAFSSPVAGVPRAYDVCSHRPIPQLWTTHMCRHRVADIGFVGARAQNRQ